MACCLGIAASFWQPWAAAGIYVPVVLGWLVPAQRIELPGELVLLMIIKYLTA